ncbi:hypothetical protein EW145_g476 [Phellinidium pouzarii]|uniref:Mitochondrial genome maintenance protein MGM101 n=1 Tax=Phellinidium pouzarii TaxID=167371 RepID=A0A4S4LIT7_9AGAM|nr:hypothetical protein EW145_g476 [Phellinidium pouzarii]
MTSKAFLRSFSLLERSTASAYRARTQKAHVLLRFASTAAPVEAKAKEEIKNATGEDVPPSVSASVGEQASNYSGDGTKMDWSRSYFGLSLEPFSKEAADVLQAPLDPMDIEMKPDGLIYLPEIKYRRILNKAFGPGGWGLAPRSETNVGPKVVSREYALVCLGRLVGVARGEQEYFDPSGIPTATEACKSNALMRCCKDLGIASELWDPRFIRQFKKEHCIEVFAEHATTKKKKKPVTKGEISYSYQPTSTGTASPAAPEASSAAQPTSKGSLFDLSTYLESGPVRALFSRAGVNISEKLEVAREQEKIWDERVPLITDDNYEDLIIEEQFETLEEEKDRVWFIVISVSTAQREGISKFVDEQFDKAFDLTQEASDLPHVRWGRIDYMNVTAVTTKWGVWRAPFLVVLKDRGQTLRFYRPGNIRLDPEVLRAFLKQDAWERTEPWRTSFSPGGRNEFVLEYIAIAMTKMYNVTVMIPRWLLLVITGSLGPKPERKVVVGTSTSTSSSPPEPVATATTTKGGGTSKRKGGKK